MFSRLRTRTNPVFYPDHLRLSLTDDPQRVEQAFTDPGSIDLLTWNIFASLDTHADDEWVAYRLQALGGTAVDPPVRMSLWSGRSNAPELRSSHAYLEHIRHYADPGGGAQELSEFADPIEVPVRVETPSVLLLIDTAWHRAPRGNGGRDRFVELIDAGLDHARRVDKKLALGIVYATGSNTGEELSYRINQLRDPDRLAAEMPWRRRIPAVVLREMSWQQLLAVWEQERNYLDLAGQPVRGFLSYAEALGLR